MSSLLKTNQFLPFRTIICNNKALIGDIYTGITKLMEESYG
jgi:hypothetical protein